MDRTALQTHLESWFPEVIAEAAIDLDPVLDAVEAVLAMYESGVLEGWAIPLAEYFFLKRADFAFDSQIDITTEDGDSYKLNQLHANVQKALAEAYGKVAWLVDPAAPVELTDPGLGVVVPVVSPAMGWEGEWSW